jgi:hypothetical protein
MIQPAPVSAGSVPAPKAIITAAPAGAEPLTSASGSAA